MKRIFFVPLLAAALVSCSEPAVSSYTDTEPVTSYVQDGQQLHLYAPDGYTPLNYSYQRGIWLPYLYFSDYMYGKSEEEFRSAVREKLEQAKADSINTIYFHVHPCGDAYYGSDIFPHGTYYDGDYDPMQIMLDEAHARGISVHAWLNPLRCQTVEQMSSLPDSFIIKQWIDDPDCHYVKLINDRWYLDPAYPEVVELIVACADEILDRYNIDGVHIDDYFYPTSDPEFDRAEFESSGSSDLSQWRLDNINRLVKSLYDTVKNHGNRYLFGISPQGSINADYNSQFADVRLWGSEPGYCDYLLPQIYYGFRNETLPFEATLSEWEALVTSPDVSLVIGLAAYKLGREDQWAGAAGELEWIEEPDVIERQIAIVEESSANGYALYY